MGSPIWIGRSGSAVTGTSEGVFNSTPLSETMVSGTAAVVSSDSGCTLEASRLPPTATTWKEGVQGALGSSASDSIASGVSAGTESD